MMAMTNSNSAQKEKNFGVEEERWLVCSFLYVLQDPVLGNGMKANTFWNRVHAHYKSNNSSMKKESLVQSLETK